MLTIGKLSKLTNSTNVTIRYYEKIGLIASRRDPINGYRKYEVSQVSQMKFIENAKRVGFSLDEIKELFELEQRDLTSFGIKQVISTKLNEIAKKIDMLQNIHQVLSQWEEACDGGVSTKKCPILNGLYDKDSLNKIDK